MGRAHSGNPTYQEETQDQQTTKHLWSAVGSSENFDINKIAVVEVESPACVGVCGLLIPRGVEGFWERDRFVWFGIEDGLPVNPQIWHRQGVKRL